MTYFYSAGRNKVSISLSPDDVGVLFNEAEVAASATRFSLAATGTSQLHESSPRNYNRVMMLHDTGAARTSFATVRNALRTSHVQNVRRTLPVYVEDQSGLRLITTREITVRFRPEATEGEQAQLLMSMSLTKERPNEFNPHQFIVTATTNVDEYATIELANSLSEQDELVEFAAPNFISEHRKAASTRDPLLASQWHLNNVGQNGAVAGEDVDAFLAWDIMPGGSPNVVIAIVDDGIDITHPDLSDNIWSNPDPLALDRNGRNFYDDNYDPRPRYFRAPYNQLEGNDIHGTPCAGVAAASSNRRGGVGIAYNCKILPVKVWGADDLAPNSRVANSRRYSGRHAQVISCSWSGPTSPDLESAIADVVQTGRGGRGCLVFCASGNSSQMFPNQISFPASHPLTLAVGASNDQGVRARYSQYSQDLDFVAPSSDPDQGRPGITTTDISQGNRGFELKRRYTANFGGTSSATPLAAGIAALVLSLKPNLSWTDVRDIMRNTAEKIDQPGGAYQNGFSLQYGFGRLNAHEALKLAQTYP